MAEDFSNAYASAAKGQIESIDLMKRLIAVAQPASIFAEPVSSGDHTVITASEFTMGMGFGTGIGGGSAPATGPEEAAEETEQEKPQEKREASGMGGGGGGGGGAMGRPVAAIIIGPQGVRVEPIVDPTKIALAFFTMLGSMFMMLKKMRRG